MKRQFFLITLLNLLIFNGLIAQDVVVSNFNARLTNVSYSPTQLKQNANGLTVTIEPVSSDSFQQVYLSYLESSGAKWSEFEQESSLKYIYKENSEKLNGKSDYVRLYSSISAYYNNSKISEFEYIELVKQLNTNYFGISRSSFDLNNPLVIGGKNLMICKVVIENDASENKTFENDFYLHTGESMLSSYTKSQIKGFWNLNYGNSMSFGLDYLYLEKSELIPKNSKVVKYMAFAPIPYVDKKQLDILNNLDNSSYRFTINVLKNEYSKVDIFSVYELVPYDFYGKTFEPNSKNVVIAYFGDGVQIFDSEVFINQNAKNELKIIVVAIDSKRSYFGFLKRNTSDILKQESGSIQVGFEP